MTCNSCQIELGGSYITVGGQILCQACDNKRMLSTGKVHMCHVCNESLCPINYSTCLHCKGYGRATLDSLKNLRTTNRPTPETVPVVAV